MIACASFLGALCPLRQCQLRADDRHRCAQLMAGIAGEVSECAESGVQSPHERVDRFDQPFHLLRHVLPDRAQIILAAQRNGIAEAVERTEREAHRHPDDHCRRDDQHTQPDRGLDQQRPGQLIWAIVVSATVTLNGIALTPEEAARCSEPTRIKSPRNSLSAKAISASACGTTGSA